MKSDVKVILGPCWHAMSNHMTRRIFQSNYFLQCEHQFAYLLYLITQGLLSNEVLSQHSLEPPFQPKQTNREIFLLEFQSVSGPIIEGSDEISRGQTESLSLAFYNLLRPACLGLI